MPACRTCGFEYDGDFKFCPECGVALVATTRQIADERKVVSILFCDLVGFTAASESADPEDVDRVLSPYAEMVRAEIEAHGGTVEKFIGDAAVGVFGSPAVHEDDPERAVRAGLRIVEAAKQLASIDGSPLRLRVGVNTGEVLVRLSADPGVGERMLAGDAVNTAARLQSVAPEMGVAVGLSTYLETREVFDYAELEPAALKGKAKPVPMFHARALARLGVDLMATSDSQFIGRESELALLESLLDETMEARSVRLAVVVGEPGIGKSRIVAELLRYAQVREPRLTWRQGRCLPYGDGVTFWALGEIVKAHAGILETDGPKAASTKLDSALPKGVDREWMAQRLLPLVGVEVSSQAEREELFAAWGGFLEALAEHAPTVLVFEDLHWADDAMLAFLEHLAHRAGGVPLLVISTARPELLERRSGFASGLDNFSRVRLAPLADRETLRLVSSLLDTPELPAELQHSIVARSGGNPLYAEEFVRLLKDSDVLVKAGSSWELREGTDVPLPGSIQALIAARLDTLPAERKSMLADAAVVGKVFWAGAVAAMGGRDLGEVTGVLEELSRQEFVRPALRSSMAGEVEYAFWHVLTRDVAYGQLPRPSRAARHVAGATWLEEKAGERVEDIAEVLAHHYATALDLTRAAGQADRAAELEAPALRFLTLSGQKALGLDLDAARGSLRRALELAPPGSSERASLLTNLARAEGRSGHTTEALDLYEEAVAAHRGAGDEAAADRATLGLAWAVGVAGDETRSKSLENELLERLDAGPPSELLALVYCAMQFHDQEDRTWGEKALAISDELDLPLVRHRALQMRGLARANCGDPGGVGDLRASLALALEQQATRTAHVNYVNLTWALCAVDPAGAVEVADEGIAFAHARGQDSAVEANRQWAYLSLGRWDELLDAGRELVRVAEPLGHRYIVGHAAGPMTLVLTRRGMTDAATELARSSSSEVTRDFFDVPQIVALRTGGEIESAVQLLQSVVRKRVSEGTVLAWNFDLGDLAREAATLGRPDLLDPLLEMAIGQQGARLHTEAGWAALVHESAGRHGEALALFVKAEDGWREFGDPYEQAHALLGQGRCLNALGRADEAVRPLTDSRDLFARLGAAPALSEVEPLLQE